MALPLCDICGTRHAAHQAHVFKGNDGGARQQSRQAEPAPELPAVKTESVLVPTPQKETLKEQQRRHSKAWREKRREHYNQYMRDYRKRRREAE